MSPHSISSIRSYDQMKFMDRAMNFSWLYLFLITAIAGVGYLALYSAAGGHPDPWAMKHAIRFCAGVVGLVIVSMIDLKIWYRYAYVFYAACFILLVGVALFGKMGMGAARWVDLGFVRLQPSEIMKIAVILALARYFHNVPPEGVNNIRTLIPPILMAIIPAALVYFQPDLGTCLMIIVIAAIIFFLAGLSYIIVGSAIALAAAAMPIAWHFMHDYQRKRVLTFLNPESDPLGSGYHITQSKIALGSGGVSGKGYLQGTQSHLNFLPEKQTDFIFTLLAEEWGFIGGCAILFLFILIMLYGYMMAFRNQSAFGRILTLGLTTNFLLYVFVNISMVMGLIPVVGVPLPMISNGGSAMLAALFGFGLIMCAYVHRDYKFRRNL